MPWGRSEQAEGGLAARHARGSHRKRHRYRQLTSAKNEFWRTDDERLVRIVTDVGAVFRFEDDGEHLIVPAGGHRERGPVLRRLIRLGEGVREGFV